MVLPGDPLAKDKRQTAEAGIGSSVSRRSVMREPCLGWSWQLLWIGGEWGKKVGMGGWRGWKHGRKGKGQAGGRGWRGEREERARNDQNIKSKLNQKTKVRQMVTYEI